MNQLQQHLLKTYQDSYIVILGFGREGLSTYHMLRSLWPEKDLYVIDQAAGGTKQNDSHLHPLLGLSAQLPEETVVFKTPGISPWETELQAYIRSGKILTSQMNEFLRVYRNQVIGVTGTKGKSTTASLITHFLEAAKMPCILAGNIGKPVFDIAADIHEDTTLVVEMSSYQLETVHYSPHIAVLLNLFPEHLNHHRSLENYLLAKAKITQFQSENDVLIYNKDSIDLELVASNSSAHKIPFSGQGHNHLINEVTSLHTVIKKNNLLPAFLVLQLFKVDEATLLSAAKTFQPLPHRLESVGTFQQLTFYDDTLATIPEATIQAIDALGKVDVILLGGYDRGIDYRKIVDRVISAHIPQVIFFPSTGQKMYDLMKAHYTADNLPQVHFVNTMEEAVRVAYHFSNRPGTVLLSPASPSFGQFKDYEDKSAQFVYWIKKLAHTSNEP